MYLNSASFFPAFQSKSNVNEIVINGQKFIERSEYNGSILKLTKKDKAAISDLRKKITELELELLNISKLCRKKGISEVLSDYFEQKQIGIEAQINAKRTDIETIKYNRHKKQAVKTV